MHPGAHALVERRRGSYEKRKLLELQKRREEDDNATTDNLKPVNDTDAEKKRGKTSIHSKTITSESKCDKIDAVGSDAFSLPSFDRVLVDAECSTDGAIRHIEKRLSSSRSPAWNDTNMHKLVDHHLQKRVIESGFRLLKREGSRFIPITLSRRSRRSELSSGYETNAKIH